MTKVLSVWTINFFIPLTSFCWLLCWFFLCWPPCDPVEDSAASSSSPSSAPEKKKSHGIKRWINVKKNLFPHYRQMALLDKFSLEIDTFLMWYWCRYWRIIKLRSVEHSRLCIDSIEHQNTPKGYVSFTACDNKFSNLPVAFSSDR